MKNSNRLFYFWKILWFVGLIIIAIISVNYENQFHQTASETFNFIPVIWSKLYISIIFGLYISLVFVKKWSINIDPSLLWCVAIPCMLLSFSYPILATLSSTGSLPENIASSSISFLLLKIYSSEVFGIITGLTLILSFFAQPRIIKAQKTDNQWLFLIELTKQVSSTRYCIIMKNRMGDSDVNQRSKTWWCWKISKIN